MREPRPPGRRRAAGPGGGGRNPLPRRGVGRRDARGRTAVSGGGARGFVSDSGVASQRRRGVRCRGKHLIGGEKFGAGHCADRRMGAVGLCAEGAQLASPAVAAVTRPSDVGAAGTSGRFLRGGRGAGSRRCWRRAYSRRPCRAIVRVGFRSPKAVESGRYCKNRCMGMRSVNWAVLGARLRACRAGP